MTATTLATTSDLVGLPRRSRVPVFTLARLLLQGRASAGRAVIDLLTVTTFTISTSLLLSVVAGARTFSERETNPPQAFLDAIGPQGLKAGLGQLPMWTFLACGAGLLLIVPLVTLASAAARMGALGRDQRLATLRLLGVSGFGTVRLAAIETMVSAAIGAVLGIVLYLALLPVWATVSFEAAPLQPSEMLMPWWLIAAVVVVVVALAGAAAVAGLRDVRISPLGVSRRGKRRGVKWQRVLTVPLVIIAWLLLTPLLNFLTDQASSIVTTLIMLTIFMVVVNLVGPLVLQVAGQVLVHLNSASSMLAGRRLLDDPRGAWRNVAGLAFTGFVGGAFLAIPTWPDSDPVSAIFGRDLSTGTTLTMIIAFVTAAASTALNQTASVLDRRGVLVHLDHAGTPRSIIHSVRRREVLVPTLCASLGSAGLSAMFFITLGAAAGGLSGGNTGLIILAGVIVAGVLLVMAASESCRPIVRTILTDSTARAE